jgi:very-short-patch-repair endonuclease
VRGDLKVTMLRYNKNLKGYIKDIGLRVLRFSDKEVFKNTQGVLERIWGICGF